MPGALTFAVPRGKQPGEADTATDPVGKRISSVMIFEARLAPVQARYLSQMARGPMQRRQVTWPTLSAD
jgi:hypothetical protein